MRFSTATRRGGSGVSIRLMLSYTLDWIIILGAAGIGAALSRIPPNKRPISLGNPEISFPHRPDTVTPTVLFIISLGAPAAIITIVSLILVPGPSVPKSVPKSLIWKRKLWEWFTGWLGLGMSCASAWLITSGLKNLVGKPRPDVLDRCLPDLANIAKYAVSNFPTTPLGSTLVSASICQQTDAALLDDGWRSWPSGHSSFSASGLVYLSLFLASKLALTLPFLAPKPEAQSDESFYSAFPSRNPPSPHHEYSSKFNKTHTPASTNLDVKQIAARNQAASPPLYLLALAFVPTGAAMFVSASRFSDFRHHGFDVLSGSTLGAITAFAAFRYYHLPLSRGAGWSWGPRSRSRAFWAGVGTGSYVGDGGARRTDEHSNSVMMADLEDGSGDSAHPHGLDGRGRDTDEFELLERGGYRGRADAERDALAGARFGSPGSPEPSDTEYRGARAEDSRAFGVAK